ncbi:MAG: hypothetical protein ACXWAV_05645 [Chthoniobacterales bacterium]
MPVWRAPYGFQVDAGDDSALAVVAEAFDEVVVLVAPDLVPFEVVRVLDFCAAGVVVVAVFVGVSHAPNRASALMKIAILTISVRGR